MQIYKKGINISGGRIGIYQFFMQYIFHKAASIVISLSKQFKIKYHTRVYGNGSFHSHAGMGLTNIIMSAHWQLWVQNHTASKRHRESSCKRCGAVCIPRCLAYFYGIMKTAKGKLY